MFLTLCTTLLLATCGFARAQDEKQFSLGPDIDRQWIAGTKLMYSLDLSGANREFRQLIVSSPTHPAGYLALAALEWWKFSQNYDMTGDSADKEVFETTFLSYANKAVSLSENWLDNGGDTASADFIMGTAYGLMARWYAVDRSWWSAFVKGKKGRKYLLQAVKLNPRIYDAYAGLGIYDYYADSLPGVLKLSALLFVNGDRKRGMEELEICINKGRFFNIEAQLFYISILVQFEKDYAKALLMVQKLRDSDPGNIFFRFVEFLTVFNMHDWDNTIKLANSFLEDLPALKNATINQQAALFYLAAGDAHIAKNEYGQAISMFNQGINTTPYPDKGWVTFCYLRRGQIYDILGDRNKALADYKTVSERPNFWDSASYAKAGRKTPFTAAKVLDQINDVQ